MSTAPLQNPAPSPSPAAFGRLIDGALQTRGRLDAPEWSLAAGELAPQLLCRYAAGSVTTSERAAMQELLVRHTWALERITKLVQGVRADSNSPLAAALVEAASGGDVDPYRLAAVLALKDLGGNDDAIDALSSGSDTQSLELASLPRALCSLGARDLDAARSALASESTSSPSLDLARKVAAHTSDDEALVELLKAL